MRPSYFKSKNRTFLNHISGDMVVVITGASTGIGEQLAYRYAERGAKIVLAARSKEKL